MIAYFLNCVSSDYCSLTMVLVALVGGEVDFLQELLLVMLEFPDHGGCIVRSPGLGVRNPNSLCTKVVRKKFEVLNLGTKDRPREPFPIRTSAFAPLVRGAGWRGTKNGHVQES